jgi:hypothetical protein
MVDPIRAGSHSRYSRTLYGHEITAVDFLNWTAPQAVRLARLNVPTGPPSERTPMRF